MSTSNAESDEPTKPAFDDEAIESIRHHLLDWYDRHRRDLPWRDIDDPYATWVSEIMLQQTQVSTVVDYYERWLERFPTLESVAEADREEVLDLWEGLGYYRRARYLHRSAQQLVEEGDGTLPDTADELEELPGIGPYTAGAIASIAFDEPTPVVDGNVARVLSRLRTLEGDPKERANEKIQWRLADQLVDPDRPGDFNQAMMELGSAICTPQNPNCLICPVREHCQAFETGQPEQYPEPTDRPTQKSVSAATAVTVRRPEEGLEEFAVVKRPAEGLLGGLWEFPTVELEDDDAIGDRIDTYLAETLGLSAASRVEGRALEDVTHLFSHIRLSLSLRLRVIDAEESTRADDVATERPLKWIARDRLDDLPMSMAMRRVEELALDALDEGEPV